MTENEMSSHALSVVDIKELYWPDHILLDSEAENKHIYTVSYLRHFVPICFNDNLNFNYILYDRLHKNRVLVTNNITIGLYLKEIN